MTTTYYQDELRYLREVGPEFARANPEIARYLADRGADPDVERMLEGVAFLCGRIRQKLDDELPELTGSLMALLWPHYLRPVPSMSILEFRPDIEQMQAPLEVKAGAEFASIPIDGTHCRYRSCWPTLLRPWTLTDVRLESDAGRPVRLVMSLKCSSKTTLDQLRLDSVRLFLAGDPRTTYTLHLLLTGHVASVSVGPKGAAEAQRIELPPGSMGPSGLGSEDTVLPYPKRSFPGFRLLQEYFAFKERFLFVRIKGLDRAVAALGLAETMEISVTFNRRLESFPLVSRENVRLHCVPVINLFEHAADPIRVRHDRVEHLVLPSKTGLADRRHAEVFSVDSVAGVRAGQMETSEYRPFYSFDHMASSDPNSARYYQTRITPNVIGADARFGTDTYISIVSPADARDAVPEETISLELTCTNRDLPLELRAGDICEPTDSSPPGVRFANIIKPTPTLSPPLGKSLHWKLISHMALNYVSLTRMEHLRQILTIYDFQLQNDAQRAAAHERMLDGITDLRTRFVDRLVRGATLRGVAINLELNEDHFAGEGDAHLLACVLDRFFGLYVTLNGFSQLSVRLIKQGQTYRFPARWGDQFTPAETRWDDGD